MARYFLIRRKTDGAVLPDNKAANQGKGLTQLDPQPLAECLPKLYADRRAAQIALTTWLKGEAGVVYDYGKDEFRNTLTPRPERRREDYEVAEAKLTVVG